MREHTQTIAMTAECTAGTTRPEKKEENEETLKV